MAYEMTDNQRFLPDGRFVFTAYAKALRSGPLPLMVVVDGVESEQYSGFNSKTLTSSPDGKHVLYAAQRNNVWRINLDGVDSAETYDDVPATGVGVTAQDTFRVLARRGDAILSLSVTP